MGPGELNILDETINNKPTNLGKKYTITDLINIWKHLSLQIKQALKHRKSVTVKEVGTFTLRKWELNAGIQHEIKHFEPAFCLSKALLEEFDLHERKQYVTDNVPVTPINYCELAATCNCSKETVIMCIDEVVQCLRRLISNGSDLSLKFPEVGELKIHKTVASFTFSDKLIPEEKEDSMPCQRYEFAMKPYYRKYMYPCSFHAT